MKRDCWSGCRYDGLLVGLASLWGLLPLGVCARVSPVKKCAAIVKCLY